MDPNKPFTSIGPKRVEPLKHIDRKEEQEVQENPEEITAGVDKTTYRISDLIAKFSNGEPPVFRHRIGSFTRSLRTDSQHNKVTEVQVVTANEVVQDNNEPADGQTETTAVSMTFESTTKITALEDGKFRFTTEFDTTKKNMEDMGFDHFPDRQP